ncbi:hypothetical protein J3458_000457 [Metarhizium acridum]|nr:hypothetical protein J3458_000457 [Metarhizium acridum]
MRHPPCKPPRRHPNQSKPALNPVPTSFLCERIRHKPPFTQINLPAPKPALRLPQIHYNMPTTSSARLRSIYRSILRELPPRPVLASPRSHLHNLLRTSFTDSSATSHAEAEQLVAYLRSQRLYVTLIERYNPGMDMDEEERVRLTARRVGMDMPELYGRGKKF